MGSKPCNAFVNRQEALFAALAEQISEHDATLIELSAKVEGFSNVGETAESLLLLGSRLDTVEADLSTKVLELKGDVETGNVQRDDLANKQKTLLGKLAPKVSEHDKTVSDLSAKIKALEENVTSYVQMPENIPHMQDIQKRLDSMEATVEGKVQGIIAQIGEMQENRALKISELEQALASLSEK